jgi:hypothetical protein
VGDKLLLKLNIDGKPIANKYYEGKMKRTLKRGLKDLKSLSRKRLEGSHLHRYLREQASCWGGRYERPNFQTIIDCCVLFECKRQIGHLMRE